MKIVQLIILAALIFVLHVPLTAQEDRTLFAFIQDNDGALEIWGVDPLAQETFLISTLPKKSSLEHLVICPNKNDFVVLIDDSYYWFNLSDNTLQKFYTQEGFEVDPRIYMEAVLCNPESTQVALVSSGDAAATESVWIYTLETNSLERVTDEEGILWKRSLVWSHSGDSLIIHRAPSYMICEDCSFLEIFDLKAETHQPFLDLSGWFNQFFEYGVLLCDFKWSPDDRYLAFQRKCPSNYFNDTRDSNIFVLSLETLQSQEVLNYDELLGSSDKAIYNPTISYDWIDPEQLIISIHTESPTRLSDSETRPDINTTWLYNARSQRQTTLFTEQAITDLFVFPSYDRMAFNVSDPTWTDGSMRRLRTEIGQIVNGSWVGKALPEIVCINSVSPQQDILLYAVVDKNENCGGPSVFYDMIGKRQFLQTLSHLESSHVLIGWIILSR